MDFVKSDDSVLLLSDIALQKTLKHLSDKIVYFDSINTFLSENESELYNKFDIVLSYLCNDSRIASSEVLIKLLKVMKPKAKLIFQHTLAEPQECTSNLKISGFISVSHKEIETKDNKLVFEFHCEKPNFEVGSSVKLSIPTAKSKASAVWKLEDSDEEVINDEELLDLDDLKKPDPSSLRVCGTTGKRKACKDCSCGLAEELKAEATGAAIENLNQTQKSSCGSCYLGDAFRCATCPYLGMPAFKPGEKVTLSNAQMKADL